MGRKPKAGLDFAGWSVSMFDGDTKIDKLLDSHGWKGFGIYFFLCQMAYKFDGYFYRWCFDDSATTARRMGAGITSASVEETVRTCLRIGLFDSRTFDEWGILTSRGIQKSFCIAINRRDVKSVIQEYWLLTDSETSELVKGLEKCALNHDFTHGNSDFRDGNSDFRDGKKPDSKEEDSKGKDRKEEDMAVGRKASSSSAVNFFLNRINPAPSMTCLEELKGYEADLGAAVCIRAMMVALDEKKSNWAYIRGILRNKQRAGIRSLEAWDAYEAQRSQKKNGNPAQKQEGVKPSGEQSVSARYGVKPDIIL